VFNFVTQKRKIESDNVGRISALGAKNMIEKMMTWLVKDKIFNACGLSAPGSSRRFVQNTAITTTDPEFGRR
jgi:hypothetical protein